MYVCIIMWNGYSLSVNHFLHEYLSFDVIFSQERIPTWECKTLPIQPWQSNGFHPLEILIHIFSPSIRMSWIKRSRRSNQWELTSIPSLVWRLEMSIQLLYGSPRVVCTKDLLSSTSMLQQLYVNILFLVSLFIILKFDLILLILFLSMYFIPLLTLSFFII